METLDSNCTAVPFHSGTSTGGDEGRLRRAMALDDPGLGQSEPGGSTGEIMDNGRDESSGGIDRDPEYRRLIEAIRNDRHNPSRHLELARHLCRKGLLEKALSPARVARALQPQRLQARLLLAWLHDRLDHDRDAEACWRDAVRLAPFCRQARYRLGLLLLDKGDLAGASEQFRQVVRNNPRSRAAYLKLAETAERSGDPERALVYLEHVSAIDDTDSRVYLRTGRLHRRLGRPSRALKALRKALDLAPDSLEPRTELCRLYLDEEEPGECLRLAEEGLRFHPGHVELVLLKGLACEKEERHKEAIAAFVSASRAAPGNIDPLLGMSRVYRAAGDLELAEEALERALELAPCDLEVCRSASLVYLERGKNDRAEAVLEALAAACPGKPEAWRLLGQVRLRLGRLEAAADAYSRAIDLVPADAGLFCLRARVHVERGLYDEALSDFQRARELDPDCEPAGVETELINRHKNLRSASRLCEEAEAARARGDFTAARKHYAEMLELVPDQTDWLAQYARMCVASGDGPGALGALERLDALSAGSPGLLAELGELYAVQDRYDQALRCFERLVEEDSHSIPARIRIIELLSRKLLLGTLSPDRFPRLERAYMAGLSEGGKESLAHLELAYLYLCLGSQIFPVEEWRQRCADHFTAVGHDCDDRCRELRLVGEFRLARLSGFDDQAVSALASLCELRPMSDEYALALLEYLKTIGDSARGLRLARHLRVERPGHGLILSMELEFFAAIASRRQESSKLLRKRLHELQRTVAEDESAAAYLELALGLMILSPPMERFDTGRKVSSALNRARNLDPHTPWPLWAMLREEVRRHGAAPGADGMNAALPGQSASICRNGMRLFPDFVPFTERLGAGLIQSRDPFERDRGRNLLLQALMSYPGCAGALYSLGRHYEKTGDKLTARLHYAKVLDCIRGTAYARLARERMNRLV